MRNSSSDAPFGVACQFQASQHIVHNPDDMEHDLAGCEVSTPVPWMTSEVHTHLLTHIPQLHLPAPLLECLHVLHDEGLDTIVGPENLDLEEVVDGRVARPYRHCEEAS